MLRSFSRLGARENGEQEAEIHADMATAEAGRRGMKVSRMSSASGDQRKYKVVLRRAVAGQSSFPFPDAPAR